MGFRYQTDGLCYVCGRQSEFYCDHCRRYTCEDHRVDQELSAGPGRNVPKFFRFCKDCYKKGKTKAIDPYRHIRNIEHT